ncbi:MAG: DUF47 domain-containing protein [Promethearchaeota archaeon]
MTINPETTRNQERQALYTSQDHVRLVLTAIREFGLLVEEWINQGIEKAKERVSRISDLEQEANSIKWSLLNQLSQSTTLLQREDLMRLVMSVDRIADNVEGAGFRVLALGDQLPPDNVCTGVKTMVEVLIKSAERLRESIFVLSQNVDHATNIAKKVDEAEEEVDVIQRRLIQENYDDIKDVKLLLKINALIYEIEDTADRVKDAADAVRLLSMILHT